jgi:AraC family transcriptional regulator
VENRNLDRFFEGRYGRLSYLGATGISAMQANDGPVILARHDGNGCTFQIGADAVPCGEADLLFVNPGEPHGCTCGTEGDAIRVLAIHLSQSWALERFPAVFGGETRPFSRPREEITPRIRRLVGAFVVEMVNDQFLAPERLDFMVQEMVLSVVDAYVARRRGSAQVWRGSPFADARIRDAIALLRLRPSKELNMDTVASKVGLSRSRFYDLFQVCTGLSPRDYLDKLCVETAITRLASSGAKIAEVSADLGFSAQSNFTRFFLHQVGIPPSEYRRVALRNAEST